MSQSILSTASYCHCTKQLYSVCAEFRVYEAYFQAMNVLRPCHGGGFLPKEPPVYRKAAEYTFQDRCSASDYRATEDCGNRVKSSLP